MRIVNIYGLGGLVGYSVCGVAFCVKSSPGYLRAILLDGDNNYLYCSESDYCEVLEPHLKNIFPGCNPHYIPVDAPRGRGMVIIHEVFEDMSEGRFLEQLEKHQEKESWKTHCNVL